MKINPEMRGNLPRVQSPKPWTSQNGDRRGWQLTIPGNRPLATPAVVDGRVFLGAGFGSYEFYAFDAVTGKALWQYQTEDDGPTAAVVHAGCVAFNTESCELEVLTVQGERVWKKWLGDPLMSMPAMNEKQIFQVYPDSRGTRKHFLAAFERTSGRERWKQEIPGEIITAPVLAGECVYLTNLDGTISCFHQETGEKIWQEQKQATSSPAVWHGECYFSRRQQVTTPKGGLQQTEGLSRRRKGKYGKTKYYDATVENADWLDHDKRKARSPYFAQTLAADAGVGFAFHKGDAKMEQAEMNLGHGHVSSLWAYQGSKPFCYRGRLFSAVGFTLHCLEPQSEETFWKQELYDRKDEEEILDNTVTPPALVNGKVFVGTTKGEICCLSAESGDLLWREDIGEPIVFQPAVAAGRVYAGTGSGKLLCLETGDANDDGWLMWGGNASHNGIDESTEARVA